MIVKDLIKALQKCDQNAEVYTEGCNTNETDTVVQYTNKKDQNVKAVYIGDCMDYVEDGGFLNKYKKKVMRRRSRK